MTKERHRNLVRQRPLEHNKTSNGPAINVTSSSYKPHTSRCDLQLDVRHEWRGEGRHNVLPTDRSKEPIPPHTFPILLTADSQMMALLESEASCLR